MILYPDTNVLIYGLAATARFREPAILLNYRGDFVSHFSLTLSRLFP